MCNAVRPCSHFTYNTNDIDFCNSIICRYFSVFSFLFQSLQSRYALYNKSFRFATNMLLHNFERSWNRFNFISANSFDIFFPFDSDGIYLLSDTIFDTSFTLCSQRLFNNDFDIFNEHLKPNIKWIQTEKLLHKNIL